MSTIKQEKRMVQIQVVYIEEKMTIKNSVQVFYSEYAISDHVNTLITLSYAIKIMQAK